MKRRILSITGTRADYGLMRPVFETISRAADLEFHLIVTGMHFLPRFETALADIHNDSYGKLIEIPVSDFDSTSATMAQTLGTHIQSFVPVMVQTAPDLILLQGDRGEMLAGAIAAAHLNIPIVHMSGGDRTGTIDDSIRHAITKFAHIHLPTCESSRKNLLAMNEEETRINVVGEPALDTIRKFKASSRSELSSKYSFDFEKPFFMLAQHSVTTEANESAQQITETLEAVKSSNFSALVTSPNSDAGGSEMLVTIHKYVKEWPDRFRLVNHLGQQDFFSALSYAAALIGNTSAGILEAPSFKTPVINIGTRQHERLRAANVIDAGYDRIEIASAMQFILNDKDYLEKIQSCTNPYGQGDTAEKTTAILKSLNLGPGLISKWIKGYKPL